MATKNSLERLWAIIYPVAMFAFIAGFVAVVWLTNLWLRDKSDLPGSTIALLWGVLGGVVFLGVAGWAWSRVVIVETYIHPRPWLRGSLLTLGLLATIAAVYFHSTRMRGFEGQGFCTNCGRLTGTGVSYGGEGFAFHYYCPEHIHQAPAQITIQGRAGGDVGISWRWWLGVSVPLLYLILAMSEHERDTRRSIRGYAVVSTCGVVYALLVTMFPPYALLLLLLALAYTRFTFSAANP